MTDASVTNDGSLALTFDSPKITAGDLTRLVQSLSGLVREVSETMVPDQKVEWQVRHVSKDSPLTLEIFPVAQVRHPRPRALDGLNEQIIRGIREVQTGGARPDAFSDAALRHARHLVESIRGRDRTLELRSSEEHVRVTQELGVQVDSILEGSYKEYGSIEGTLDAINLHGQEEFEVYDRYTGKPTRCYFDATVDLERVIVSLRKRVLIEGEVSYRKTGEPVSMKAESLYEFPPEDQLPTFADVRGILR